MFAQHIDFSPTVGYGYLGIYSSLTAGANKNDLVSDAFDFYSYVAILCAWIGILCVLHASVYNDLMQTLVRAFGNSFNQV